MIQIGSELYQGKQVFKISETRNLPGGSVAKTPHSQCRARVLFLVGEPRCPCRKAKAGAAEHMRHTSAEISHWTTAKQINACFLSPRIQFSQ